MIRSSRRSGVCVPLFSLRSSRSWGLGEIGDIPVFAQWMRSSCLSTLQILPLNELAPSEFSPYSALSAMAIDPQFISVWMMEDAEGIDALCRSEIESVRRSRYIDYAHSRDLKTRALKASFERFLRTEWVLDTERAALLRAYISSESWWLDEYSLYRALRARAGERPWTEWSAELRDRDADALRAARDELSKDILYAQYVQWVAATQWQTVRRRTPSVELLGDFPFMVTLDSADVWSRRNDFILDASVGTPPDAFSATGQEWGLPPYNWHRARANNFEWMRMRARRQADLYDGFRVDHLVGFYRTYVRPLDKSAAYFMPESESEQIQLGESLMRIMIETGADVSVEDLGTVPPFVRESIARLRLPGYKVLRWEPVDPAMYPPMSVAMTGTHDTEPLAVWWETLSSAERRRFALDASFTADVRDRIIDRMFNAGSDLVLLPIQDIFGWRDRINTPATISAANWTYVLPWPIDQMEQEPEARDRSDRLAEWASRSGRLDLQNRY